MLNGMFETILSSIMHELRPQARKESTTAGQKVAIFCNLILLSGIFKTGRYRPMLTPGALQPMPGRGSS